MKLPKPRKPKYGEIVVIWTILTVGLLFGGQYWFQSWSTAKAFRAEMPATGQAVAEMQAAQHQKLASGPLDIEEAMQRLASADRNTIPLLVPEPSQDMAPAAGWMHMPGYEAPPVFDGTPIVPPVEETLPQEDTEETDATDATDAPEEAVEGAPNDAPAEPTNPPAAGVPTPPAARGPRPPAAAPNAPAPRGQEATAPAAPRMAPPAPAAPEPAVGDGAPGAPMTATMMNAPAAAAAEDAE